MSMMEDAGFASETDENALEFIQNSNGLVTTREVADACDRPRSTAYDALRRLEDSGHIEREKHGNSIEWRATPTDTSSTSDSTVSEPSSPDIIPSDPTDITGSEAKELRETAGLSRLEVTEAGDFYASDIKAWEDGEVEFRGIEKQAVVSFITKKLG